jgi:hypothetical protein
MLRAALAGLLVLSTVSFAENSTALSAIKLLPKDAAKRLARIEAREGNPWPERWYFLVYDPALPRGLREFAVADGTLKANRSLSQFADILKPAEVIGADAIKVDSDSVSAIAARYTVANGMRMGALNYELGKYGEGSAPAWRIGVENPAGDPLGILIINARTGAVERHDGFDKQPAASAATPPVATKPATPATPTPAPAKPVATTKPAATPTPSPLKPFVITRPAATPAPTPRPNAIKRIGGSVKKLFGND